MHGQTHIKFTILLLLILPYMKCVVGKMSQKQSMNFILLYIVTALLKF